MPHLLLGPYTGDSDTSAVIAVSSGPAPVSSKAAGVQYKPSRVESKGMIEPICQQLETECHLASLGTTHDILNLCRAASPCTRECDVHVKIALTSNLPHTLHLS